MGIAGLRMCTPIMPRLLLAFSLWAALLSPASSNESAPVATKRTVATLIGDKDSVTPGGQVRLALRLRLADGWHTYWKNPGEAGIPPELTVTLPAAASIGPIDWPTPRRFNEGSVATYAYTGEVILPVTVQLPPDATGLTGLVLANWLVCREICVPEEASFAVDLPAGSGAASAQAPLFAAHDRARPRASPWSATIAQDGTLTVRGPELGAETIADASFFPDRPGSIDDGAAQLLSTQSGGFSLGLHMAKGWTAGAGLSGVLSVRDRSGARTDVVLAAIAGPVAAPPMSLLQMLGFAFLGGLILNLMPCVFPVLAMKVSGLASGGARVHGIFYTGGVLVAFGALAAALLGARAVGAAAGWGFQFASPVFVAAMAWLLFAVGLNLSGVFQIGGAFVGVGGGLAARGGHWGSFFTGLLAVLVATPCTAPFMGAAVAAGLAAPPAVTMLVFLVMGLGLASPWLVLPNIPGLGRRFPRPGPWMEILRQGLAFPMYGAAVWLLWVVEQEAGAQGVLGTGAGFVLLGFAAWSLGVGQTRGSRLGWAGAGIAVVAACMLLVGLGAMPEAATAGDSEPFSAARLAAARADRRPVFVNLTAAWCVTCLVNERVAIGQDAVRREFAAKGVVYLKGDWTRQDPAIGAFLRENGRDGVPLYLYYGPGAAVAEVLPQILTAAVVLKAMGSGS